MKSLKRSLIEAVVLAVIMILFVALIPADAQTNDLSRFDRFINPANGVCYAFVEAPVAMLQTFVPEGAEYGTVTISNAVYDASGTNLVTAAVTRQKTMAEFVVLQRTSLDGSKVIVLLAARQASYGRTTAMTPATLAQWEVYMSAFGFPVSSWLDLDAYRTLLSRPEYSEVAEE